MKKTTNGDTEITIDYTHDRLPSLNIVEEVRATFTTEGGNDILDDNLISDEELMAALSDEKTTLTGVSYIRRDYEIDDSGLVAGAKISDSRSVHIDDAGRIYGSGTRGFSSGDRLETVQGLIDKIK